MKAAFLGFTNLANMISADPIPDQCFSILNVSPESTSVSVGGSYFMSDLNYLLGTGFDHSMSLASIGYCERRVDAEQAILTFF